MYEHPSISCPPSSAQQPPPHTHTYKHSCFTPAYLSSVPHVDEGTHGLEGPGATGQEVGAVVGLQKANKVGTLGLQNKDTYIHTI